MSVTHSLRELDNRRGVINVLLAFLMIGLVGMVAFAVDIGYLLNSREELQRTADATAMAACWKLGREIAHQASSNDAMAAARGVALQFASLNDVCKSMPSIDGNSSNTTGGDVVFGYISDVNDPATFTTTAGKYNAVKIRVRRTSGMNGKVPFTFGRVFGLDGQETEAHATAMLVSNIKGFKRSSDGQNLDLLPFALDQETWDQYKAGAFSDDWAYDEASKTVSSGADGLREINLYPQDTGSPGNRGTVDIGGSNNSTNDIARQITDGISDSDLEAVGGSLEFDSNGELSLNGDTGISAGVKDELESIKGQPRVIPIFSQVVGPGNNADYTIVKWVGIRIMEVKLTGSKKQKRVMIQEAPVMVRGVIPGATQASSESVYSPAFLFE